MIAACDKIWQWILKLVIILLGFFQINIISVSPSILYQNHHIGVLEIYAYDESSVWEEVGGTGGLSRVLSIKEVRPEHEILAGAVRVAAKGGSSILLNTSKQLQAKFKHAGDFGVIENYNKANAGKFSSAINQHINSAGVRLFKEHTEVNL